MDAVSTPAVPDKIADAKRGKQWERLEVDALVSFVKANRAILFGSGGKGSFGVEHQKMEAWELCRSTIVAAGGSQGRTWEKVRKKWQDLASKAKKYSVQRKAHLKGTGGGSYMAENTMYEDVLNALPEEIRDGIMPIDCSETTPTPSSARNTPSTQQQPQHGAHQQPQQHRLSIQAPSSAIIASSQQRVQQKPQKRPLPDTETEDSQESQEKRRESRRGKGKKKQKKGTDEVDLLQLNKTMSNNELEKVRIMGEMLVSLRGIHKCLEKLTNPPAATPLPALSGSALAAVDEMLNQMRCEQQPEQ